MRELAEVFGILAFCVTACTAAPAPSGGAGDDFARYQTLPDYRAFAVTGGTLESVSYAAGWSTGSDRIDEAVEVAVGECNGLRDASTQRECVLYAIGNIVVADADVAQLERVKCVYVLSPTARSLDDPYGARCAAAQIAEPTPSGEAGSATTTAGLSEDEIRSEIIGNTLAAEGSYYAYVRSDGTAAIRSGHKEIGSDTGSWRLNGEGYYCSRWRKVEKAREVCRPMIRRGDLYELGDSQFSVITGNPFGL